MARRKKRISIIRSADEKTRTASASHTPIGSFLPNVDGPSQGVFIPAIVSWMLGIANVFAFSCVALQPISSDQTWWQLSRGRQAIVSVSLWPSVELLINEERGEANAIGAVVSTAIYLLLGADGWMIARLLVIGAALGIAFDWKIPYRQEQRPGGFSLSIGVALLAIAMAALSPHLDAVPILFDILAMAWVTVWICRFDEVEVTTSRKNLLCLSILFCFWANFGDHVFIGLVVVFVAELSRNGILESSKDLKKIVLRITTVVLIAGVSAMINPIGWGVWFDSFAQSAAWAIAPAWTLVNTDWLPLTQVPWRMSHYLFGLLTLIWCIQASRGTFRRSHFAVMMLMQFFAWSSAVVMPLAIVAITVHCLVAKWQKRFEDDVSCAHRTPFLPTVGAVVGLVSVSAIMIHTVGWGFDADLDPRMLEIALRDVQDSGTVLTDDSRSTGMMAWVLGPVVKDNSSGWHLSRLHDEPRRALIGGRLAEQLRLFSDLRQGRQMSYWRDDESLGGWWLPLTQRHTSLVVCSRRDLELIRRLEPTIWKPLSLDSPVLPYARAGDPIYTPQIIDLLGQREWVDSGLWDYQPPPSTGSAYDRDRFGLFSAGDRSQQTFDQADVFAAMELRTAALEVLNHARAHWPDHPRYVTTWRRCQVEWADWELVKVGQASLMRTLASGALPSASGQPESNVSENNLSTFALSDADGDRWERLIAVYYTKGAAAALQVCQPIVTGRVPMNWEAVSEMSRAQLRYAAICWAFESGRRNEAIQWAEALRDDQATPPLVRLLAQHQLVERNWIADAESNDQLSDR